jgi:hypothetical protein
MGLAGSFLKCPCNLGCLSIKSTKACTSGVCSRNESSLPAPSVNSDVGVLALALVDTIEVDTKVTEDTVEIEANTEGGSVETEADTMERVQQMG